MLIRKIRKKKPGSGLLGGNKLPPSAGIGLNLPKSVMFVF